MKFNNGEYKLSINGINHWVKIEGYENKTMPLILIHGGPGGNHYNFERTVGRIISKERTVVYYEQRGSGRSDKPESVDDYSIDLLVSDLKVLKDLLGIERADLLGYSFGGELALEIAYAFPNDINKLVLSGPSLMYSSIQQLIQIQGFMSVAKGSLLERIETILKENKSIEEKYNEVWSIVDTKTVNRFLFEDQSVAELNRKLWEESGLTNTGIMMKALYKQPPKEKLLNRLNKVTHDTLILTGLHDRNTGLSVSKMIDSELINSRLELFHKSAHFPDMEETEKFVSLTLDFLSGKGSDKALRAVQKHLREDEIATEDIRYVTNDKSLSAEVFLSLVNAVWPGKYNETFTYGALQKTMNITAWENDRLVGCVRILTDGYFFGMITEILVHPEYQGKGIGKKLMELAWEASPTSLFLGAQPGKEPFFEKLDYTKGIQSYQKKKERRQ
jgi:proline iminopeptidase